MVFLQCRTGSEFSSATRSVSVMGKFVDFCRYPICINLGQARSFLPVPHSVGADLRVRPEGLPCRKGLGADTSVYPKKLSCLDGLGADTWGRPYEGARKFILGSAGVPPAETAG